MRNTSSINPVTIDVKQYGGKQIVIYRNRIVASGESAREALRRAQAKYPRVSTSELRVFAVPKTIHTVYAF